MEFIREVDKKMEILSKKDPSHLSDDEMNFIKKIAATHNPNSHIRFLIAKNNADLKIIDKQILHHALCAEINKLSDIDEELIDAISANNFESVNKLLLKGAKIRPNWYPISDPMYWADSQEMVDFLLRIGYPRDKYEQIVLNRKLIN